MVSQTLQELEKLVEELGTKSIIIRSIRPTAKTGAKTDVKGSQAFGLTRSEFQTLQTTVPTISEATVSREYNTRITNKASGNAKPIPVSEIPDFLNKWGAQTGSQKGLINASS